MDVLNNLQERNNSLKSKLRHEQLKYGIYKFNKFKNESLLVLDAYENHKSIFKAASSVGVDKDIAMKWFIRGMEGDPRFRPFYLSIAKINGFRTRSHDEILSELNEIEKLYDIAIFEDAWVYTTQQDGIKISIISGNLDNLRQKVKARNLPLL
ncbi:MAG: hypothetical protein E7Z77_07025 [Methanobrevibacter sp.]|uniref:hypothetical protein n=1 Tax=Methanobrevibacter sp. TaxID=66852 RepID=UPI0025CE8D85|nr:hypothetical protein [Methanobrevibacter sp.]MBE6509150.1 hypothetical protein [Methanobrevibacter sp.]